MNSRIIAGSAALLLVVAGCSADPEPGRDAPVTGSVAADGFAMRTGPITVAAAAGVAPEGTPVSVTRRSPAPAGEFVPLGDAIEVTLGEAAVQPSVPVELAFDLDDAAVRTQLDAGHTLAVLTTATDGAVALLPATWEAGTLRASSPHLSQFVPGWLDPTVLLATMTDGIQAALNQRYPKPDCVGRAAQLPTVTVTPGPVERDVAWACISPDGNSFRVELTANTSWVWQVRTDPARTSAEVHGRDLAGALAAGIFYQTAQGGNAAPLLPGDTTRYTFPASSPPRAAGFTIDAGLSLVSVALAEIELAGARFGMKFGMAQAFLDDVAKLTCAADAVEGFNQISDGDIGARAGSLGRAVLDCAGAIGGIPGAVLLGAIAGVVGALFSTVAGLITTAGGLDTAALAFTVEAEPVLGGSHGEYSVGYGTARPGTISVSSLCANSIHSITWQSWGGETATGNGTHCHSAGRAGVPSAMRLIASDKGDCGGVTAYRKLAVLEADSGAGDTRDICPS